MSTCLPDQIAVKKASGFNLIGIQDWLNLTFAERVELFQQDKVQFLREGDVLDPVEALRALKQQM